MVWLFRRQQQHRQSGENVGAVCEGSYRRCARRHAGTSPCDLARDYDCLLDSDENTRAEWHWVLQPRQLRPRSYSMQVHQILAKASKPSALSIKAYV
ncbi:hypothetical protein H257_16214 [Aphanomyces astaci]|uniref:Uncharacterized protein n=1 Tax=Aphanomyces astaci TaxID=112090 RepID=W4FJE4_APHAT|nr:hypothetical protein H257_16214 [Aphanomyces astaci]ETV67617.1 hypothetical protein H257_16214 [Aphanomyces astaci]|eukprot:XP_009842874.1 hypothetical protein H257_16214 [Aphanomyces astaci]